MEKVSVDINITRATFEGVWSVGPVFKSKERNLTEPVKGIRMILMGI